MRFLCDKRRRKSNFGRLFDRISINAGPNCGDRGNEVELANEAVEAAIRISAHVEFTNDSLLKDLGGVAALLRW